MYFTYFSIPFAYLFHPFLPIYLLFFFVPSSSIPPSFIFSI
jgi:hypothetical protein